MVTLINDKNKKKNTNEMDAGEYESPHLSEDEIENLDLNSDIVKKYMARKNGKNLLKNIITLSPNSYGRA
ncbi:MAG: hypothetical protein ACTSRH_18950 [Promethearchaeota archaeon]